MEYFGKFKGLFCLAFAFMFMFGNALFVQASTLEFTEKWPLKVELLFDKNRVLKFTGLISHQCAVDPYGKNNNNKKIIGVNEV